MASLSTKTELTPLSSISQHDLSDILDDFNFPSEFENEWSPALLGSLISDPTAGFGVVPNDHNTESNAQEQFSFTTHLNNMDLLCKTEPVTSDYHYTVTNAPVQTNSVAPVSIVESRAIEGNNTKDNIEPVCNIKMSTQIKREDCCSPLPMNETEGNSIKIIADQDIKKEVRSRGRPRRLDCHSCGDSLRTKKDNTKKPIKMKKTIHLWEFLEQILDDNTLSPRYIAWVSREEGIFRLVNSKKVAQLWGQRKNKRNMTYEKMSRAMRYYYERGILYHVNGQKLIYKFGDDVMSRRQDSTSDSESSEKSV